jgi:TonB family protein
MNVPNIKRQLASSAQKPFTIYLVLSIVFHLILIAGLAVSTQWLHKPRRYKPAAHTVSLIDAPSALRQASQAKPDKTADKKPASGDKQPSSQPTKSEQQTKTTKRVQAPPKRTVPPTQDAQAPKKTTKLTTAPRPARIAKSKTTTKAKPTASALKPQRTIKPSASTPKTKTKRQKETRPSPPSRTPAATTKIDQARQQAAEQRLTALRSRYGKYGESTTGTETTESLQHVRLRAYQELVREQIIDAWVLPLLQDTARNMQATALLTIDRAGRITQLEILETSNNPLFDESLIRAIRQAAPLPALPEDYRGAYLELELHFKPDAA